MNRQQEYAQLEAELIAKHNAEQTVEEFIASVKQYNHSIASVQTLIVFNKSILVLCLIIIFSFSKTTLS